MNPDNPTFRITPERLRRAMKDDGMPLLSREYAELIAILERYTYLASMVLDLKLETRAAREELASRPTVWAYEQVCKANDDKRLKLAAIDEALSEENLAEIIHKWKHFWMNQTQNSEEDRKNYFDRAFGIDANMKYHLVSKIRDALKGGDHGSQEIKDK